MQNSNKKTLINSIGQHEKLNRSINFSLTLSETLDFFSSVGFHRSRSQNEFLSLLDVQRDLANGYSYAEILRAYFPDEINMFTFINGRALNSRLLNWAVIKKFIKKKELPVAKELIDATLHEKDGAAEQLLEKTYELLTNKK